MKKNKLYIYNPVTDDFERYYPNIVDRVKSVLTFSVLILLGAVALFFVVFYFFDTPTEENLRIENMHLRSQYNILSQRLDNSLRVMEDLRSRDDNFYRVMMQLEPMTSRERFSGLERENRYEGLSKLSDARLLTTLTQQLDFLDRQIYAQSKSFDELRDSVLSRKDKMAHIPSIIPIRAKDYTLASGFGKRKDPMSGVDTFHKGIDLSAPRGTNVIATADGVVEKSAYSSLLGEYILVDHGYNYKTLYAHLNKKYVKEGDSIKRGKIIGDVGSSGKSVNNHLHYEVWFKEMPQDPVNYYFMDLTPRQYTEMIRMAGNAGYVMD